MREELSPETIISALPFLREEGYEVLSLSGGEPLLYSGFEAVVCSAVDLGFRVNLITNGAPVGGRLLNIIAKYVNLVAVSLDGAPKTHNELRGDANAFLRAERAIDRLRATGVRFGLAFCVSRESLADMPWAVEFAEAKGAALVQFHPFAATGRGRLLADRLSLSESDKARAYFIASLLDMGDGPALQIDLAPVSLAIARCNDYCALVLEDATRTPLSDLVNPLIIDETGLMSPLSYGVERRFALGKFGQNISDAITFYKENRWLGLRTLLEASFAELGKQDEKFVDWFYHVVKISYTVHELD